MDSKTARLIKLDMKAAGIPWKGRDGLRYSSTPLRNCYISLPASPAKAVQKTACHRDLGLTYGTYAGTVEETHAASIKCTAVFW